MNTQIHISTKFLFYLSLSARKLCFRSCGKLIVLKWGLFYVRFEKSDFSAISLVHHWKILLSCFSLFQIQTNGEKFLKRRTNFLQWKNCKFQTMSIIVRRSIHLHIESQKYMYSFPMSESLLYQTGLKRLFRKIVWLTNKSYKWSFKTSILSNPVQYSEKTLNVNELLQIEEILYHFRDLKPFFVSTE